MKKIKYKKRKGLRILFWATLVIRNTIIFVAIFIGFYYAYLFLLSKNKLVVSPLPKAQTQKDFQTFGTFTKELIGQQLQNASIDYSSIKIASDSSFFVKLSSGEEVIFSSKKNPSVQTASLQLILSRFTIEGKKIRSVDFRFEKPVVVF